MIGVLTVFALFVSTCRSSILYHDQIGIKLCIGSCQMCNPPAWLLACIIVTITSKQGTCQMSAFQDISPFVWEITKKIKIYV